MPTETLSVRPEVFAFALLMEKKLKENDHKGGWSDVPPFRLLHALRAEVEELTEAVRQRAAWRTRHYRDGGESGWNGLTPADDDIAREAADVANFAMMIADCCGQLEL